LRALLFSCVRACLGWGVLALAPGPAPACEALIGSEYTEPAEVVPMNLDPVEWHIAARGRDQSFARKEWVKADETASEWTELRSWQLNFGNRVADLEAAKDQFLTTLGYQCPDVKSGVLRKEQGDLLFEWWHGECYGRPAQHHIERLVVGKMGTHRLSHSHKGPRLSDPDRDAYARELSALRVVSRVPEGKLTPLQKARVTLWMADYAKALEQLKPLAEKGDPEAQDELGGMYAAGLGVAQSYPQALEWFRKAAALKNVSAAQNLARFYDNGWGVPKDPEQALQWYRTAAELGDSHAQGRVGYLLATAPEPKYDEAMKWFRKSAEQGHEPAIYWLGRLHEEGWGVAKDLENAVKLYREAAVLGDSDAQYRLAVLHREGRGVPHDETQARKWVVRSVMQGNAEAEQLYLAHYRPTPKVPIPDKATLDKKPWDQAPAGGDGSTTRAKLPPDFTLPGSTKPKN
jgi:TPR repeat protein